VLTLIRSNSDGSGRPLADPHRYSFTQSASPLSIATSCVRCVLSVGHTDDGVLLPDALNQPPGLSFSNVHDYRDLWRLSKAITYDAVVFHNSVGNFELQEAARLVRGRWPSAKILLIRSGEITLDDSLYDQRLRPPVDPDTLVAILSGRPHLLKGKPRARWRMAHALGS
jgi:hypothetical protein